MSPACTKADIDEALEKGNASDSDSDSSSGSSGSSSSSSFGKKLCEDEDGKAKKKPKVKAKPAAKAKDPKVKADKVVDEVKKLTPRFDAAMNLLQEIQPETVWRSLVRSVEVDRRLSKSGQTLEELKAATCNSKLPEDQVKELERMQENLFTKIEWITAMKELSRIVRTSDGPTLSKHVYGSEVLTLFGDAGCQLFDDKNCLADIVHTFAKKIFEVPRTHTYNIY